MIIVKNISNGISTPLGSFSDADVSPNNFDKIKPGHEVIIKEKKYNFIKYSQPSPQMIMLTVSSD